MPMPHFMRFPIVVHVCSAVTRSRGYTGTVAARPPEGEALKLKVVVHEAEEGGFWAEVPAIPGCCTQGETFEQLLENLSEAIEGCLSVDVAAIETGERDRIVEIAI